MWLDTCIKPENESTDDWYEEEIQVFLQRYNDGNRDVSTCSSLMVLYSCRGDEENAIRFGNEMLQLLGDSDSITKSSYYFNLARMDIFYKRWESAINNYHKANSIMESSDAYYDLSACYAYLNDLENAEKYGVMALEIERLDDGTPNFMWEDIGRLLANRKKYKEAIEIFGQYSNQYPEKWYPLFCIGQCYQDMDDPYRAMAYYQKALVLDADNPHVYNNLGAIAINEDSKIQEGISYLKHALAHIGDESTLKTTVLINLTRAYNQIADYDQAQHYQVLMLQNLGFPVELTEVDEDEEE